MFDGECSGLKGLGEQLLRTVLSVPPAVSANIISSIDMAAKSTHSSNSFDTPVQLSRREFVQWASEHSELFEAMGSVETLLGTSNLFMPTPSSRVGSKQHSIISVIKSIFDKLDTDRDCELYQSEIATLFLQLFKHLGVPLMLNPEQLEEEVRLLVGPWGKLTVLQLIPAMSEPPWASQLPPQALDQICNFCTASKLSKPTRTIRRKVQTAKYREHSREEPRHKVSGRISKRVSNATPRIQAFPNDGGVRKTPVILQATSKTELMDRATQVLGLSWGARRIFMSNGHEIHTTADVTSGEELIFSMGEGE